MTDRASVAFVTAFLVCACTASHPAPTCIPGEAAGCVCTTGAMGAQVCSGDGTFGPCRCDPAACIVGRSISCACSDGLAGSQVCDTSGAYTPCSCRREPTADAFDPASLDAGRPDGGRPDAAGPDGGCGPCIALGVRCGLAIAPCGEIVDCGPCAASAASLEMDARDLVYDASRGLVLASVAGAEGVRGNSIAAIDPSSASVVWSTYVGSEPRDLALDADGRRLWIALGGTSTVRSLDLDDRSLGAPFSVGASRGGVPLVATALAALPSGGLAVVRVEVGPGLFQGLAVYDDGVPRAGTSDPLRSLRVDSLAAIDDGLVIGSATGGTSGLTAYRIDGTGVVDTVDHRWLIGAETISFDGTYVVGDSGEVVDPVTMTRLGRCAAESRPFERWPRAAVSDPAGGRILGVVSGDSGGDPIDAIVACDRTTFTEVGRVTPTEITGPIVRSLVWPGEGLILLAYGDSLRGTVPRIWFVRTDLVAAR